MHIKAILRLVRAIPVITLHNLDDAFPLAKALLKGGITVIEITLRTRVAISAIKVISETLPEMIPGAGTILEPEQLDLAKKAGARFAVSPGLTPALAAKAMEIDLPYLPGAVTASEIMIAKAMGFNVLKFFPAEIAGGVGALKQFGAVFPDIEFCPTGGIQAFNMQNYLELNNVITVGGGWLAPEELISRQDWGGITQLARQVSEL